MKGSVDKKTVLPMLIIQTIILIATAITAVTGILYGASSSQDGDNMIGVGYFKAFTMDINILAGICAVLLVFFTARRLLRLNYIVPARVVIFQHAVTTGLFLTFVTVLFFLAPMDAAEGKSFWGMFSNDLFIYHLMNPLLAIISFVFFQDNYSLKKKDSAWSLLPLVIYICVYILMVVVFRRWDDFYNFSLGGKYYLVPVVIAAMVLLNYGLARLLIRMNAKALVKRNARI